MVRLPLDVDQKGCLQHDIYCSGSIDIHFSNCFGRSIIMWQPNHFFWKWDQEWVGKWWFFTHFCFPYLEPVFKLRQDLGTIPTVALSSFNINIQCSTMRPKARKSAAVSKLQKQIWKPSSKVLESTPINSSDEEEATMQPASGKSQFDLNLLKVP